MSLTPNRASAAGGYPGGGAAAAASVAASSSSTSRRQDASASSYDRHWKILQNMAYRDLEHSAIAVKYGCKVERLFGQNARSRRKWSALLQGESMGLYETKEEAIKRTVCAALVMNDTNHVSGAGLHDPLARASSKKRASSAIGGGGGSSKRKKSGRDRGDRDRDRDVFEEEPSTVPEEFPVGRLSSATAMDDSTLVTLRQPPRGAFHGDCIACQRNKADLVFEPCQHNVLCSECNKKGICSKWCPICRTPITKRIKPSSAVVVRPHVYSAYSFM